MKFSIDVLKLHMKVGVKFVGPILWYDLLIFTVFELGRR